MRQLREVLENPQGDPRSLRARIARLQGGASAIDAVHAYGDRFHIVRAATTGTDLATIRRHLLGFARGHFGPHSIAVIDYLQKVVVPTAQPIVEDERVTLVVEGLKDLALEFSVPWWPSSPPTRRGSHPALGCVSTICAGRRHWATRPMSSCC